MVVDLRRSIAYGSRNSQSSITKYMHAIRSSLSVVHVEILPDIRVHVPACCLFPVGGSKIPTGKPEASRSNKSNRICDT